MRQKGLVKRKYAPILLLSVLGLLLVGCKLDPDTSDDLIEPTRRLTEAERLVEVIDFWPQETITINEYERSYIFLKRGIGFHIDDTDYISSLNSKPHIFITSYELQVNQVAIENETLDGKTLFPYGDGRVMSWFPDLSVGTYDIFVYIKYPVGGFVRISWSFEIIP